MDIRILYCIGAILLVTKPVSSAEIKKWVDQNGQIHYGDRAPHGIENVLVKPKITTTSPSSNSSLKKIMRPGELGMLKNYEKRSKRLIKAKRKAAKQAKLEKKQATNSQKRCNYHRRKKDDLKRRLRKGYSRSEENRIEDSLARHDLKIDEYCN
jgi:hypothetical protein